MNTLTTMAELEAIYGRPAETATAKVANTITAEYRAFIAASPFISLATAGPEGLDCSPRGDLQGFVRVQDEKTLLLPDRHGNNRVDSLRNVIRDPRVALLFLVPGVGNTIRVNGRASISIDPTLLATFEMARKLPRSVLVVRVEEVYFQCARALVRSELWNPARHVNPRTLPSPGQILASMSANRVGGEEYDRSWSELAQKTLW